MEVFSYTEMYTTILAWNSASKVLNWLLAIGAPAAAYIVVSITIWVKVRNTDDNVERIIDIFRARHATFVTSIFFVSVLFIWSNWTTVDATNVVYRPGPSIYDDGQPDRITPATDNNSEAAEVFKSPETIEENGLSGAASADVPVGAYFSIAAINAFTRLMIEIPPDTADVIAIRSNIAAARATDPQTGSAVARFINDCYLPAKERARDLENSGFSLGFILPFSRGDDSNDWPGAEEYFEACLYEQCDQPLATHGPSLQALSPVPGFTFVGANAGDRDYTKRSATGNDTTGFPYCDEWWEAPTVGIQAQLREAYDNSYLPAIAENETMLELVQRHAVGLFNFFSDEDLQIRSMLENTLSAYQEDPYYLTRERPGTLEQFQETRSTFSGPAGNTIATLELGLNGIIEGGRQLISPITAKFKEAGDDAAIVLLPYYQAFILLLMIVIFYPVIILSGFNWQIIGAYLGAYAGVRLANGVWAWVYWFDVVLNGHIYEGIGSWADDSNRGLFIYTLYYGGALIATLLTGFIGWKGGQALNGISQAASAGISKIGEQNANAARTGVNTVASVATGGRNLGQIAKAAKGGGGKGGNGGGGGATARQRATRST